MVVQTIWSVTQNSESYMSGHSNYMDSFTIERIIHKWSFKLFGQITQYSESYTNNHSIIYGSLHNIADHTRIVIQYYNT